MKTGLEIIAFLGAAAGLHLGAFALWGPQGDSGGKSPERVAASVSVLSSGQAGELLAQWNTQPDVLEAVGALSNSPSERLELAALVADSVQPVTTLPVELTPPEPLVPAPRYAGAPEAVARAANPENAPISVMETPVTRPSLSKIPTPLQPGSGTRLAAAPVALTAVEVVPQVPVISRNSTPDLPDTPSVPTKIGSPDLPPGAAMLAALPDTLEPPKVRLSENLTRPEPIALAAVPERGASPEAPAQPARPVLSVTPSQPQLSQQAVAVSPRPQSRPARTQAGSVEPSRPQAARAATPRVASTAARTSQPGVSRARQQSLMAEWGASIRSRIVRRQPNVRGSGVAVLRVTVGQAGQLLGVSVAKSSGSSALDRAALSAVQRAGRFRAAPEGLTGSQFSFTLPVRFR